MRIAQTTDIVIVGVNYKDRPTKALQWLAQYGNPYDVVLDDRDGLLGIEMGVYGAPETFLHLPPARWYTNASETSIRAFGEMNWNAISTTGHLSANLETRNPQ